jgi:hypothetical protein
MVENEFLVQKVRAAIGDRALYLALLVRSFSTALPKAEVERLARKAIHEFGEFKGKADQQTMTPKKWVTLFDEGDGADLFAGQIVLGEAQCEQQMTYCPLMAAWKELGCSDAEMDLLCDIAMEVDRGRADFHKIPYEINERLAKGDSFCRLVLKQIS